MKVFKDVTFEAAHFLPNVPDGHKCGRLHGHSYRVQIEVEGRRHSLLGWIVDYADIDRAWAMCYDVLDHRCLNDIPGLWCSTSENLAEWIATTLGSSLDHERYHLARVTVRETCTAGAVWEAAK